jgi:hypothetical protein
MEPDDTCNATTRDGEPCKRRAGWGTDHKGDGRCKQHGGAEGTGAPTGEAHGSYEHGGFAAELDADDETIIAAFEQADPNNLSPVWMRLAGEAYSRYQRSDDARHLSECRRCLENAGDGEDVDVTIDNIVADFTPDAETEREP